MHRGEVWRMSLDHEFFTGEGSVPEETIFRMVVILSSDALAILPLRIVVPLTSWKEEFTNTPWLVRVPPVLHSGLDQAMAADALQVRSVSTARLKQKLGNLPGKIVEEIATAAAGLILH